MKMQKESISDLGGRLVYNEPLSKHATFRIGGRVRFWFEPLDLDGLKRAIEFCKTESIPYFVIGSGSNILFRDTYLDAMIIHLDSSYFRKIELSGMIIKAGAGVKLAELFDFAIRNGFRGLEFLAGIPGTVGGGIFMNAGSKDKSLGSFVIKVTVLDKFGKVSEIENTRLKFGNRTSNLTDSIILGAYFLLEKGDTKESGILYKKYLEEKLMSQELVIPSAGCIFKNPPQDSAGRLIELSGLKGKRVNDAMISSKHANFILNKGGAKAGDVLELIKIVRDKVKKDHGVELELEIILL